MDVSLGDVSRVIRLVQEVCDRWDDPRAWREYLLHGTCALLGGNAGWIMPTRCTPVGTLELVGPIAAVGVPADVVGQIQDQASSAGGRAHADVDRSSPGFHVLVQEFREKHWVTAARDELTDPATYHASANYLNHRRLLDLDDYVVSVRFADVPRRVEVITIDRPHGAEPFGPREVALLTLLHDEIAPLVGVRLATEAHLTRDGLSRRLRETLALLLDGRSEKEVAAAMHIGSRTVHDHVTALYEHFRVCSRAELLAYFVRRQPTSRGP